MNNRTIGTITKNLIKTKELINTPDKWIQNLYSNEAHTKFCMLGALMEILTDQNYASVGKSLEYNCMFEACDEDPVYQFNDTHSHEEVMEAMNRAIDISIRNSL